jgi:hypothetical protein
MKKNTARGQVFISQIKNENPDSKNIITIKLTYPLESFRRKVISTSNFYKVLSNGKNTLMGIGTNRDWWNRHKCNGVYFTEIKKDRITLVFLISSERRINELEIKSRITKILKPATMEISYNDPLVFKEYFTDDIVFESGFQFFGSNRTHENTFHANQFSV